MIMNVWSLETFKSFFGTWIIVDMVIILGDNVFCSNPNKSEVDY